jgi:hypothetical protein
MVRLRQPFDLARHTVTFMTVAWFVSFDSKTRQLAPNPVAPSRRSLMTLWQEYLAAHLAIHFADQSLAAQ